MKRILFAATAALALGAQVSYAGGFMLMEQSGPVSVALMPVPVFSATMPPLRGSIRPV